MMKKKKYVLFLLVVSFLTGCANFDIPDTVEIIQTEEVTSEVDSESNTIVQSDIPSEYKKIIDYAYEIIIADMDFYSDDLEAGMGGIAEACAHNSEKNIGYLLYDVDGNGVQELIIAHNENGKSRILSMYSLKDGEPVLVIEGWSRNRFYILDNGMIYHVGSGGITSSFFTTYHISEDGASLAVIDNYYMGRLDESTQEWAWFHDTTGEEDVEKSKIVESEEEIWKEYAAQIKHLDLTYFIDYEEKRADIADER